jgi:endonuclease-3
MKRETAERVRSRLVEAFGRPAACFLDPVETLVLTILSQHTTDANRDRAFSSLRERFGSLDAVAGASETEIAEAIRVGGLQHQKAKAIRASLDRIRAERGSLDLRFLKRRSAGQAVEWLAELPGVGPKTAGIVVLFSLRKPYFPVDTHIARVLRRVGWISTKTDPHDEVNALLPRDVELMADLHLSLIRLGRTLCRPRKLACGECPIRSECAVGKRGSEPA